MHKKYSKFLIVSFIGILSFGIYNYFHNDLKSEAASSDSSLSSSLTSNGAATTGIGDTKTAEDTAFLMDLASLNKIKIDTDLISNKAFSLLVDNTVVLDPVPYGRINPFSPTDNTPITNNVVVALVKTNPATSVTAKSVVLNGSLEGVTSNNIYFEYGITNTFGKVTPKLIPSLVGNFSSNIILLNPKTTYYFRAVANINGTLTFGDTMSFNTN